jgi:hypothetical protein
MARYTRNEISELCNRLEARANSVLTVQPSQATDLNAAALLLRLFLIIHETNSVETTVGATTTNDGQSMN